jgi:serine/threonine protein kinase/WD40 repeat protein
MSSPLPFDSGARLRVFDESPSASLLRAWQQGHEPALDTFVAGLSRVSPAELAALIRIDLDERWRRNDPQRPEDYLLRFSAVAADAELAVDVIYAEYLAREQSGARPEPSEYRARFPEFADVLEEQIRLHRAIETLVDDTQGEQNAEDLDDDASKAQPMESGVSYEILEQIGSGGMGVVYRAYQPALGRYVALKMVRAIDASNKELLARFRSEARVVASLHHPHIVQVHDFGEHEELPYLAMELVEGGSLADRLDGTPWSPRAAAVLLIKLASAAKYAHDRGVIHRDLKPANVLIASDGPELEVKITDFGLAKFFFDESSQHTKSNAFLGTPSYMAPEQARGRLRDVSPGTDIYSLGAILYELLSGRPPYRGESPIETLRLLLSTESVSIHRLAPRVPRDLATICDKCLRSEIDRRYASATELREDLERFLEGKPVLARRTPAVERGWRWCRRNPLLAAALASAAMLLVGIAVVSLWYSGQLSRELIRSQQAEVSARDANRSAQHRLWDAYLAEAVARNGSHQVGQRFAALDTLDKAAALLDAIGRNDDRQLQLRNATVSSVALPDVQRVRTLSDMPPSYACSMSVAANVFVTSERGGLLSGYSLTDGHRLWTTEPAEVAAVPIISANGKYLAAIGDNGTKVWRIDEAGPHLAWEAKAAQFLTFAPDGEHAAYSDPEKGMYLVKASDGAIVRAIGKGPAYSRFAFNPLTRQVAVCVADCVQIIALETGDFQGEIPHNQYVELRIAWHPGGEHLAVWGSREGITLWHVKSRTKKVLFAHRGAPTTLRFNGDGTLLVSQSQWNERLLVWEVGTGEKVFEVSGFLNLASDVDADGRLLFLSSDHDKATLTELHPGSMRSLAFALHAPMGYWYKASVDPESRIVAFSCERGVELWDMRSTRRLVAWPIGICMAEFDRQGCLVIGCASGIFRLPRHVEDPVDADSKQAGTAVTLPRRTKMRLGPPEKLFGPILPFSLALNASGETLLFADEKGWALMHLKDHSKITRLPTKNDPRRGAVSEDSRYAAIANWNYSGAGVWDAVSGAHVTDLAIGMHGLVQFSPDGRLLAATPDGITLWRTSDWHRTGELHARGTTPTGLGMAFSPDSRVLAVGQHNGVMGLVDPSTCKELARLPQRDMSTATIIAFSPDQRWLATSSIDERAPGQVWDLATTRRELDARGLDWPADVLRAAASETDFEAHLDVELEGDDVLGIPPLVGGEQPEARSIEQASPTTPDDASNCPRP